MPKNKIRIEAGGLKLELHGEQAEIERAYEMTRPLLLNFFEEQLRAPTTPPPVAEQPGFTPVGGLPRLPRLPAPPRINAEVRDAIIAAQSQSGNTQQLYATGPKRKWTPPSVREMSFLNVVLATDFYNKVCVLERAAFEQSMLNEIFEFDELYRIYIPHDNQTFFSGLFEIGKVVWRELTRAGQRAVRNESKRSSDQ